MSRHQHRCGHVGRVPCHLELVATLGAWRLAFGASTMELVISALICTWVSIFVGMDGLGQFGELHIDYVSKHPSQCIGVSIFSPAMLESTSMDVKSVATLWFALSGALSLWFCSMRVSILWSFDLSKYASVSRGFYFDHYYFVFLLIHWVSPGAELEKNRRGATLYSI